MENNDYCFKLSGKSLMIESERLSEYISYINDNDIIDIYICDLYYKLENLDFLTHCPNIKNVNINSKYISYVDELYKLKDLKELIIQDIGCCIDLLNIPNIEKLAVTWDKNIRNIDKLKNLKDLRVDNYNPKSKSFDELMSFSDIEKLSIVYSNLESLKGIEMFYRLNCLNLYYLKKLSSIKELSFNKNLEEISFETCKKINDYHYLSKLNNLKKISICNCGELESIKFINDIESLEWFVCLKTDIKDGDITPCKRIKYYSVDNKKHYFYQ